MKRNRLKICLIPSAVFIVVLIANFAYGAGNNFSAEISPMSVEVGDSVQYSVTVTAERNSKISEPTFPPLPPGIQQMGGVSTSTQMNFSLMGGSTSFTQTKTWTITLQATKPGRYNFQPAKIYIDGKDVYSNPVDLVASPSGTPPPVSSPPSAGRNKGQQQPFDPFQNDPFFKEFLGEEVPKGDVFIHAVLNKQETFVNEDVVLSVYLYAAEPVSSYKIANVPQLTGFWSEPIGIPQNPTGKQVTISGKQYMAYLIYRMELFPLKAGKLVIAPIPVDVTAGGRGFFSRPQTFRRSSQELPLNVLPLPQENRPSGFEDENVGILSLEVTAVPPRVEQGKTTTISIAARGTGNIKNVKLPTLPKIEGLRTYEPSTTAEGSFDGLNYVGSKREDILAVAQQSGTITIPPLELQYFDPSSKEYKTVRSVPIVLDVVPSDSISTSVTAPDIHKLPLAPIRYPTDLNPFKQKNPLAPWFFILLFGMPIVVCAVFITAWSYRSIYQNPERKLAREKRIELRAMIKALEKAALSKDHESFHKLSAELLDETLLAVFNLKSRGMTGDELQSALAGCGLSQETSGKIIEIRKNVETARYSPIGQNSGDLSIEFRNIKELYHFLLIAEKKNSIKKNGAILLLLVFATIAVLVGQKTLFAETISPQFDPQSAVENANKAYLQGNYPEAMRLYRDLQESGIDNASIAYNLGTVYLASGELGRAIWQLERAVLYGGGNDIQTNLKLARELVQAEETKDTKYFDEPGPWRFFLRVHVLGMTTYVVSSLYVLLGLLAIWYIVFTDKRRKAAALFWLVFILTALAGAEQFFEHRFTAVEKPAILLVDSPLKEGPANEFNAQLAMRAGSEAFIISHYDEWVKIRLNGGITGWVKEGAVAEIYPESGKDDKGK